MPMFRKVPVEIEAHQFTGSSTSAGAIMHWVDGEDYRAPTVSTQDIRNLQIATLEGVMTASPGDWIIRGVQGEFYPCKPDIFAETYEAV